MVDDGLGRRVNRWHGARLDDIWNKREAERLYVVLDPAGSSAILAGVLKLGPLRARCLFEGNAQREQWSVAPYLLELDPDVIRWLVGEVWREPWGIVISTRAPMDEVYEHLGSLLFVEDEAGNPLFFRYYDPRVLEPFIESCTDQELRELTGPLEALGVKCERAAHLRMLRLVPR